MLSREELHAMSEQVKASVARAQDATADVAFDREQQILKCCENLDAMANTAEKDEQERMEMMTNADETQKHTAELAAAIKEVQERAEAATRAMQMQFAPDAVNLGMVPGADTQAILERSEAQIAQARAAIEQVQTQVQEKSARIEEMAKILMQRTEERAKSLQEMMNKYSSLDEGLMSRARERAKQTLEQRQVVNGKMQDVLKTIVMNDSTMASQLKSTEAFAAYETAQAIIDGTFPPRCGQQTQGPGVMEAMGQAAGTMPETTPEPIASAQHAAADMVQGMASQAAGYFMPQASSSDMANAQPNTHTS